MPEYLAPGVYVEETSFRARSIEGVSTATTGFIGPTRYGPVDLKPDVITSLAEFERIYGGREKLVSDGGKSVIDNYMWHAVRAFFEEGGNQLYVSRTFSPNSTTPLSGYAVGALDSGSPSAFRLRALPWGARQRICHIGTALSRPAEFVIFCIGQWTAHRKA